jgi:succinate dehydrogenase / fumarate reductase cytochrome b subunit
MQNVLTMFWSSIGMKIVSALTGLALVFYVIIHLIGNLSLLRGDPAPFNKYAHFLESLSWFLIVVELGLLAVFLFHIVMGVMVWIDKKRARPRGYIKTEDAGSPSKKTWSSKNMIITGLVLFVFTIIHVKDFKYGPGVDEGYVTVINGTAMRDLYSLVVHSFQNIYYVIGYTIAMILLGFHLRHGFWSGFQSLGVQHPRLVPLIYGVGIFLAIVLAAGFLFIPIYLYFAGGVA